MMWRKAGGLWMILTLLLSSWGVVDAKPARKANETVADLGSQTLFETEPRPGPPVMRDPEILNRGEMISLVRTFATEIVDALLDGERHRERAVREKDSIKLSCIQDRLSNMKNMKKLSDNHMAATDRSAIRADDLRLRHEFRGVELAHQRVLELRRELRECVGDSLMVTGEQGGRNDPTGTNVEIPKVERPVPASSFR